MDLPRPKAHVPTSSAASSTAVLPHTSLFKRMLDARHQRKAMATASTTDEYAELTRYLKEDLLVVDDTLKSEAQAHFILNWWKVCTHGFRCVLSLTIIQVNAT